jgi:tol-pal system protein YbgF
MFTGCATQEDVIALHNRLVYLEQRNQEIGKEISHIKNRTDQAMAKINEISRERATEAKKLRTQSAGLHVVSDNLKAEILALKGKIEETEFLLKKQIDSVQGNVNELERKLSDVNELKEKISTIQTTTATSPSGPPPPAPPPVRSDAPLNEMTENELYQTSLASFRNRNYPRAFEGFQLFLSKYPRSRHADNAQFWIGEVHYKQEEYGKAILAYQEVIENYPDGNKYRASLLKQALSFQKMGEISDARIILNDLIRKYPDSPEADQARQHLKNL